MAFPSDLVDGLVQRSRDRTETGSTGLGASLSGLRCCGPWATVSSCAGRTNRCLRVQRADVTGPGPRPNVRRGLGIVNHTQLELVALARWILSDTLLRTDDDLKREMRTELGFSRNGVRIDATLTRAVATVRRSG